MLMEGVVSDSGAPSRTSKRMKKRKQLDALVSDMKVRKKSPSSSKLIVESESSDLEGYRIVRRGTARSLLSTFFPVCGGLLLLSCILSIGLLTWMGMGMRKQMDGFRARLRHVELGNLAVPSELHDYHKQLQNFHKNQSELSNQQVQINQTIQRITAQMTTMENGLKKLEEDLKKGPELLSIPGKMEDLQKSIASFGSKLKDFENTLRAVKDKEAVLQDRSDNLTSTVSDLKNDVKDIMKKGGNSAVLKSTMSSLGDSLSLLQANVSSILPKLQNKSREQNEQIRICESSYANLSQELETMKEHVETVDTQVHDLVEKLENLEGTAVSNVPATPDADKEKTEASTAASPSVGPSRHTKPSVSKPSTDNP